MADQSLRDCFSKKVRAKVSISPPILTFARMDEGRRVAKRHGMPFLRYAPRFLEGHNERAIEVADVNTITVRVEVLPVSVHGTGT